MCSLFANGWHWVMTNTWLVPCNWQPFLFNIVSDSVMFSASSFSECVNFHRSYITMPIMIIWWNITSTSSPWASARRYSLNSRKNWGPKPTSAHKTTHSGIHIKWVFVLYTEVHHALYIIRWNTFDQWVWQLVMFCGGVPYLAFSIIWICDLCVQAVLASCMNM